MPRGKEKSPHILNAASNLVGFCIVALTSLKILNPNKTIIDEVLVVSIGLFIASIFFSFLSIRAKEERGQKQEHIADIIFLAGILFLGVVVALISFDFLKA